MVISFAVNGARRSVVVAGWESLLDVLRDVCGLPGTKGACEQGECGSCSVILDGRVVCACLVMAGDAEDSEVTTVEGLRDVDGKLNPVQQAMINEGAVQCGFCTPGFVVTGTALLRSGVRHSADDLREALSGNLCRCTGYGAILRALGPVLGTPT